MFILFGNWITLKKLSEAFLKENQWHHTSSRDLFKDTLLRDRIIERKRRGKEVQHQEGIEPMTSWSGDMRPAAELQPWP